MPDLLIELCALSTPDLVRVAHTVASLLRERAYRETPQAHEEARMMHQALVEAGARGITIGDLKAVLTRLA